MNATRILIADDHDVFRRSLRSLIESRDEWRVCGEAADGRDAIRKAKSLNPDLILMDVSMPEMNGLDATRAIRKAQPDSRILIISQNDAEVMRRSAADVGALGFIQKSRVSQDLFEFLGKLSGSNGDSLQPVKAAEPQSQAAAAFSEFDFLRGEGEMAARMHAFDWSRTPLGPMESWPQSLKTSVSICLASRFPIVMYWGPEYVVLYNDAYSSILGSKHPWALGQPCRVCWAEIWDTIGPMLDSVVDSGRATWSDDLLLLLKRRGYPEECYFSFSFSPIRVETGSVGGVFTAVMETTEKVVGERRLRTLRDLAARMVHARSVPDALHIAGEALAENQNDIPFSVICKADADNSVRVLSTAGLEPTSPFASVLAQPGSPFVSRLLEAARSREPHELDLTACAECVPLGAWKLPAQKAMILPVGEFGQEHNVGLLLAGVNPHKLPDESYRTFFQLVAHQIASGVADARSYEEERRRAEALAELDRAKTAFFSNVSHEFRTPLTLMLAPLEDMLAAAGELPEAQRERLEVAHRNSLRLLKLVNALLDFSRIEAGRIQASYEPTDLSLLTTELASVFRSVIERAGLRLLVDCSDLPEKVYVDRDMWEKIVFNLLSNAFKFTFDGEIKVSLQPADSGVELSVSDTGTGIPADEIPRLFERFHRVKDARGRSFEGSGIGLALVQELARLHGGSVRVESEVDRGSKFSVTIPFGKDHLPQERVVGERTQLSEGIRGAAFVEEALQWLPHQGIEARDSAAAALLSSAEPLKPPKRGTATSARILLADDNSDMREYVRRLLATEYEVVTVADGKAALESVLEHPPDLILSDIMMPRMDGIALLNAIRANAKLNHVPVILLSARAGEESRVEGLQAGADDYLIKPFSARELAASVRSHLSMAKLRSHSAHLQRELMLESELERKRLNELFSHIPAAICLLSGPDHRYTFVNQEYLKLTGRSRPEDFVGKTVREALPEFEGQPFLGLLDQVYATGVPHIGKESKVILNNSAGVPQDVFHNFIYQPQRGMSGAVERILVHVVDVTEQVLARRDIESRAREASLLASIVASSDDAIVSKNLDGIITSWNKSAERIFGYSAEEAVGRHITLIIPPDRYHEEDEIISRIRRGEPIDHFETVRMRKDGTLLDVSLTISPVRNAAGKVIGASKVARDITERKQTVLFLRESEEKYRELAQRLELEVASRTREIEERNSDIIRQSELLRDLSRRLLQAQDEERRRIARELHDSAGQTLTVLGMTIALIGKSAPKRADLHQQLRDAEQLVQQLHQEIRTMSYLLHPPLLDEAGLRAALTWYVEGLRSRSGLQMTLEIDEGFERLPRDMELVVFRLVQESLTNIHRHSGSKTAAIRIFRDAGSVMLEIRDQGKGMSQQKLTEIQSRGSGVGIRGMRERVRQFQGDLQIDSSDAGTRVLVTIPMPKSVSHEDSASLQVAI